MKTHEHALISLGYGAIITVVAGKGFFDPGIYLAALVGGELIDIIDHPLYQLLFARNDRVIAEGRSRFKNEGFRAGVRYLLKKEDERSFNKLRLHNFFSLTLFIYTAIFTSLYLQGSVYSFIMLGAFLLHMLTDIYGDFQLLGHSDNWLWVLNKKSLEWLGKLGQKLIWIVLLWWVNILLGFFLVSLRSAWQLYRPSTYFGLAAEATNIRLSGEVWLAYGPLVFLLVYFGAMFFVILAGAHKVNLETPHDRRGARKRFSTGSFKVIRDFLSGKTAKEPQGMEKVLLAIQSDQALWILILTVLIAGILMLETWFNLVNPTVILLTPMVCALIFGTLIHTTIGEYGGVQGVLLATFLNLILSNPMFPLQSRWPVEYGYLLFAAACGSWLLGLLGGIVLREYKCMSLIAFVFRFDHDEGMDTDAWLHTVMDIARHGLEEGYQQAHQTLFGNNHKKISVIHPRMETLVTAQSGMPATPGDFFKLTISDQTAPMLQDITYILCDNRLSSQNHQLGDFGLLPTLPRSRMIVDDVKNADIIWDRGSYIWNRSAHPLRLPSCENAKAWLQEGKHLGILKTWAEFFDDLVCRKWLFRTDLYLFPTPDHPCSMTFCGLSRTSTSTKEYSTIESEIYVNAVCESIQKISHHIPGVNLLENQTARILFPRRAFDEWQITDEISKSAVFSAKINSCFSKESADLLMRSLQQIPSGNKMAGVAVDFGKRLLVLAGQLGIAYLVSTMGYDWLAELIKSL